MNKYLLLLLSVLISSVSFAQTPEAFELYKANGKKAKYKKMIEKMNEADVVLFGELHNNSICHWMQLQVSKSIFEQDSMLTMGAEMFEADNQSELNDYLAGTIDVKALDTLARLWNNFKTDYKPLVDFSKDNALKFIATNIPRRFASQVFRGGFEVLETLSEEALKNMNVDIPAGVFNGWRDSITGYGHDSYSGKGVPGDCL